ncbi:hypothetical protein [Parageobacillus galactosidasius]|uniref:Uncharacterized protein n=1 Tax=Parageobacillus galactosidasius TaxID=883812 RepID=A0A226QTJ6_9BACL|nr:hypothetical protein [Parageobacillus galactosidasius]OXB94739.1 hypothetical protein B9L23_07700 [Parageobacillus galactosidasius]
MPVPATTGQLRTRIEDTQIGDYIKTGYFTQTSINLYGGITGAGSDIPPGSPYDTNEIPLTGFGSGNTATAGYFYFIKVAKGLLIADRVIHNQISWDTLNSNKAIQGYPKTLTGIQGIIRSLTGGVAYADANGNKSTTDQGYGGWPTNNEWDKYINRFPQELIQSGKTLDDVFHSKNIGTWTQDTPQLGIIINSSSSTASDRMIRRELGAPYHIHKVTSNTSGTLIGFRPVFEYIES